MSNKFLLLASILLLQILACGSKPQQDNSNGPSATATETTTAGNMLSMKINGVEWKADNEIFGAFHPKGYNKAIIISGSKGPKNKDEQPFNINLYNVDGPGTYQVQTGNPDLNVAQLANLSEQNYLYGNVLGFNLKVVVTKASTGPDVIEATFEGEMSGNAGDVLKITEGKFYYHE
jgi:hypothetical protein